MAGTLRTPSLRLLHFGLSLSAALAFAIPAAAQESYRVAGVRDGDWLNVRAGPSASFTIVGRLLPLAGGIQIIDECRERWCPISRGPLSGWVNSRYLELESSPVAEAAPAEPEAPAADVPNAIRTVLPDGTLELRLPDGTARRRLPNGHVVIVRRDGSIIALTYTQAPAADLPAPPPGFEDWGSRLNNNLLSILTNILTPAELKAYRQIETGKNLYEVTNLRIRSIEFLTTPTSGG